MFNLGASPHQLLDGVFDATPLLIACLDAEFNFIRVNRAYAAADGKPPEYFPGKNHFALFPNAENEAIFRRVRDSGVAHRATAKPFEYAYNPERGITHWDWTLAPVQDAAGAVTMLVLTLNNVTERLRAEESARRSEARLNEAQRIANIGSWELCLVSDTLVWSDEIFRIFEIDKDSFGASYAAFIAVVHPEDRDLVDRTFAESLNNKMPYELTHRLLMPDGRVKWVHEHGESFFDAAGQPLRAIGTVQDVTEHHSTQLKLRETTLLLDSIVQNIPSMIFMKHAEDLRFALFNKAGEELIGVRGAELLGKNDYDFFPKEQADFFTDADRAVLMRSDVVEIREEPIDTKSRGRRILHTKKIALRDEHGVPLYLLGISEDITERKHAEREMASFRSTLDQTLDCVFMFDPRTLRFSYANRGAIDQVGYGRDELLAMTPLDIKPEFDEARFRALIAPLAAGEQQQLRFETVHRHKNGETIPVEIVLQYVRPRGGEARFVAVVRDVTERKRAEEELRRLNETLEQRVASRTAELDAERNFIAAVLDTAGALVVVLDWRGHIVRFNRACERLSGYAFEDLRDRPIWDYVIPPEQRPGVRRVFTRLRDTALPSVHENEWLTRDGGRRMIAWSNSVLKDDDGAVAFVITTGIDITERKRAETALLAAKQEAERANAAKSEFLSRMSHELRTPMNAILGFAQLLDEYAEPPLRGTERENVREILRAGNHLLELINEVLDLSRIEAGRMQVNIDRVAVDSAIRDALVLVQPQAESRGMALINETVHAGAVFVHGDAVRVKQVLLNLLSNAVKFSPAGAAVRVRWTREEPGSVRIAVIDNGCGIAPEHLRRLFVPFERLDADKHAIEGTGIGLALTKRLVEMMGGVIGVDSTPGHGSTFWFTLPAAD
jgi:PAS domain S-box-containing protein